jgi:hypothetical protein
MRKYLLSELIEKDLTELAWPAVEVVPTEESIQLLIHVYNNLGLLLNARLTHIDQLEKNLLFLFETLSFDLPSHHQFFIEFGYRDKKEAGNRGSAHYAALDLFVRPGKPCLAFFADHDRGNMDSQLAILLNKLGIQVVFVSGFSEGGKKHIYQADSVHCPIFTLAHLMNSAHDSELLPLLEGLPASSSHNNATSCHWFELPPQYMRHAQSVTGTLSSYVDACKRKEGRPDEEPSDALSASRFDWIVSETLVLDIKNNRLVNKAIQFTASEAAGITFSALENGSVPEETLIDICYQTRYPLVCNLLKKAWHLQNGDAVSSSSSSDVINPHPLFELVFAQPHIIEFCLKEHKFNRIFTHDFMLLLMKHGIVNAHELFKRITVIAKGVEPGDTESSKIIPNLASLELILAHKDRISQILSPEKILDLLSYKSTASFLKNDMLLTMFLKGIIPVDMIERIRPHTLSCPEFLNLETDESRLNYLDTQFPLQVAAASVQNIDEDDNGFSLFANDDSENSEEDKNEEEDEDLFFVPPIVVSPNTSPTKPVSNPLLIRSARKLKFFVPSSDCAASSTSETQEMGYNPELEVAGNS